MRVGGCVTWDGRGLLIYANSLNRSSACGSGALRMSFKMSRSGYSRPMVGVTSSWVKESSAPVGMMGFLVVALDALPFGASVAILDDLWIVWLWT